jgi:hypothetical protein
VSEQVQRDHAVAARRQGAGQRLVHPPAQQEAVDQDDGPIALSELLIRQSLTEVRECRHEVSG